MPMVGNDGKYSPKHLEGPRLSKTALDSTELDETTYFDAVYYALEHIF